MISHTQSNGECASPCKLQEKQLSLLLCNTAITDCLVMFRPGMTQLKLNAVINYLHSFPVPPLKLVLYIEKKILVCTNIRQINKLRDVLLGCFRSHWKQQAIWGEREHCLPRVPLGQGRSTSMPLWVWGHSMSLSSVASQKRLSKGKDSRVGGEVVCGITGGGLGAPLLPSLCAVVVVVLTTPRCTVVVVVVVVVLWVWGDVVTSVIGGRAVKRERHYV